jgi:hypothetical protein
VEAKKRMEEGERGAPTDVIEDAETLAPPKP